MRKERSDGILEDLVDQVKILGLHYLGIKALIKSFEQANYLSLPEHLKPGPPTTTLYPYWFIKTSFIHE